MGILPVQAGSLPHKSNQIAIVRMPNQTHKPHTGVSVRKLAGSELVKICHNRKGDLVSPDLGCAQIASCR